MKLRLPTLLATSVGIAVGGIMLLRARFNTRDTTQPTNGGGSSAGGPEIGPLLHNFFVSMNQIGENAQADYEEALEQLRARPDETIAEIARVERLIAEENYPVRGALIFTASELRHPAALPFLTNFVQTRIPRERSQHVHTFSTVTEETILRTTAVMGVEQLAMADNRNALEALFTFLEVPSLSIRRAAVQAILATKEGQGLRTRVAALLPADQQFLLDIKRVGVHDVPQITNPQRHLVSTTARTAPPPALDSRRGAIAASDNDTPQIRR